MIKDTGFALGFETPLYSLNTFLQAPILAVSSTAK